MTLSKEKVTRITFVVPKIMQCRPPTEVDTLYLKEQFLNVKLTHIIQMLNPSLDTPRESNSTLTYCPNTIENLLCGLYLHNKLSPVIEYGIIICVWETFS